jgi:hypothetical protein
MTFLIVTIALSFTTTWETYAFYYSTNFPVCQLSLFPTDDFDLFPLSYLKDADMYPADSISQGKGAVQPMKQSRHRRLIRAFLTLFARNNLEYPLLTGRMPVLKSFLISESDDGYNFPGQHGEQGGGGVIG